jgi:hypothetical protein
MNLTSIRSIIKEKKRRAIALRFFLKPITNKPVTCHSPHSDFISDYTLQLKNEIKYLL